MKSRDDDIIDVEWEFVTPPHRVIKGKTSGWMVNGIPKPILFLVCMFLGATSALMCWYEDRNLITPLIAWFFVTIFSYYWVRRI